MFANSGSSTSQGQGHIVEFKAGRCKLELGSGSTKRNVVAEKEKGLVFIKQSEDQLMHFCWKSRETGAIVDDLIIFPGDTEFKEVKECTDGKVFLLKFNSSEDRRLFWVQENKVDDDIVKKVNDALNKPPPVRATPARERNTTGGGLSSVSASDTGFQDIGPLGSLNQGQLMQLLQFMSPGNGDASLSNLLPSSPRRQNSSIQANANETEEPSNGTTSDKNDEQDEAERKPTNGAETKRGKPDDEMELD